MGFPLTGSIDEDACHSRLLEVLHPEGMACLHCGGKRFAVHPKHRAPILDHRRGDCRRVFDAFTAYLVDQMVEDSLGFSTLESRYCGFVTKSASS